MNVLKLVLCTKSLFEFEFLYCEFKKDILKYIVLEHCNRALENVAKT